MALTSEPDTLEQKPVFHTPTVGTTRSWLAEKASYGIEDPESEHFTDPLGIKSEQSIKNNAAAASTVITGSGDPTANTSSTTGAASPTLGRVKSKTVARKPVSIRKLSSGSDITGGEPTQLTSASLAGYQLPPVLGHTVEQFIQSLKEPKFAAPLEPAAVAELYQQFYAFFASKADHYLQTGGNLPPKKREIQMETYEEIAEKKRERALRPVRLREYIETAEARACANVYERIFQPGVGDDVERSEGIQARVKAIRGLPVTFRHLDFDIKGSVLLDGLTDQEAEDIIYDKLKPAGEEFKHINDARCNTPLKKLEHFVQGHRLVVQALTEIFPQSSSTSADMILPALIYTLVVFEVDALWLNLAFICRFRNASFVGGEPSYVLTNIQAATGFLESANYESLGITDKPAEGATVLTEDPFPNGRAPILDLNLQLPPPTTSKYDKQSGGSSTRRAASSLLHSNDFVNSADQAFKNIGASFGNSYKFFWNKNDKSSAGATTAASAGAADGGLPLLSDSKRETGSCSAIPVTPPAGGSEDLYQRSPGSAASAGESPASQHLLNRFTNKIKPAFSTTTSSSSSAGNQAFLTADASDTKIPRPLTRLLKKDWQDLRVGEIRELHEDYKRLVSYLESLNAFDKR
ncbi:hypothetical protein D0Z00_001259 [Geotrichum galactomycetum]|uniref:Uncharacterized protein n=1 Tax=Geotrichum galactomycetum TaxID=27317 RepID=A0ACB6V7D6_9ASCO|nr:hypothetical protein D0Z00_001259 [Geotrichum candidum]